MIRAVVFDLDGLLSDTERLHCKAYQQALDELGVELGEAEYAEHWIRSGKGIVDFLKLRELAHEPAAVRRRKASLYRALVTECVQPMPGAVELLRRLHGKMPLALATSAYGDDARCVLRALDIEKYFDVIVSSDDVRRVKPHPDLFLLAAKKLGVAPSECVVLEDAEKGILAAASAGMKVIAVPTEHTRTNDFSRATWVVPSLDEVDETLIAALS